MGGGPRTAGILPAPEALARASGTGRCQRYGDLALVILLPSRVVYNQEQSRPAARTRGVGRNLREERTHDRATTKENMKEVIEEQPDDATYDEILRELAFARAVERGLADAREGCTLANEEMGRRIRCGIQ